MILWVIKSAVGLLLVQRAAAANHLFNFDEFDSEEPSSYEMSVDQLRRLLSSYVGQDESSILYRHRAEKRDEPPPTLNRRHSFGLHHFGWQAAVIGVAVCIVAIFGVAIFATAVVRHRRASGKRMSPQSMLSRLTGSTRSTSPHDSLIGFDAGDKKLAHSAQMYHYQHQKQQMLAMERAANQQLEDGRFSDDDLVDDDSEHDEVDFAVFECPGLAPAGDLEVKNPLFQGSDADRATPSDELSPCSHDGSTELSPNFSLLDGDREDLTPTTSAH